MTLAAFNKLDEADKKKLLLNCCGSEKWVRLLLGQFPFETEKDLVRSAEDSWYKECTELDWLEAFAEHPKIGNTKNLSEKFAATKLLASEEQSGVNKASEQLIKELAQANGEYEKKFGFIFIVCATGKSATEMLRLLLDRITNSKIEELNIAMGEQHKITILRMKKLIDEGNWQMIKGSQLTTHVLDTSVGKPAENITIRLMKPAQAGWQSIAQGLTNSDGRVADLLPAEKKLHPGNYKIVFETENYFLRNDVKGFYPEVEIQFTVFDDGHYHVPLLINPFGYSTYRGS